MKYRNHIKTGNSVILMFHDHEPVICPKENPEYEKLIKLLDHGRYNDTPRVASRILRIKEGSGNLFDIKNGQVYVDDKPLPETLSNRIVEFVDKDLPVVTFLNFWSNLMQNPNPESVKDLYAFLDKNHVPLTDDGCFVCYKKVKDNFFDCYTGRTHQYSPGSVVKMDRSKVNGNRNETCAPGLHVAGWSYMGHFSGDKIVEVKVNPKNVVAVPYDYDFTKIRVCELEVIRECPKYMDEDVQLYDEEEALGPEVDEDEDLDLDLDLDDEDEDEYGSYYDEDEDEDEDYEDEDEDEEEDIEVFTIRRLPSILRWLSPSSDGRARVTLAALEKIGVESGQTIYASVASKRSRSIVLSVDEPVGVFKKKDLQVGTASVRIPASLFRAAQIHVADGYEEYKLSCTKGTIVIRPA